MTADEVCNAALARCAEFGAKVPNTRTLMYHRINARQQQLFSHVADLEPELFGKQGTAVLAGGAFSLSSLSPLAERVTYVEILDPGTSGYAVGQRVNIVQVFDQGSELPPRATIRDAVIEQVGTDLANVTSLRVYYSKRATTVDNGGVAIDFLDQFSELLVIDLTKQLLRKTLSLDVAVRGPAIELLDAEEAELLSDLARHCEHWRFAETSRYSHSQRAQARPMT